MSSAIDRPALDLGQSSTNTSPQSGPKNLQGKESSGQPAALEALKAATKVSINNPAPVDLLIGTGSSRALRQADYKNTVHLSNTDPKAALGYSLLRDTITSSDKLDLILSERGIRSFYRAYGKEVLSPFKLEGTRLSTRA